MFFPSMYTFIIQCVNVDSQGKSWPKWTEARETYEQMNEHHVTFLNLYKDWVLLWIQHVDYLSCGQNTH